MSENRPEEITDATEQQVWDELVDKISVNVQQVQKLSFLKYKLRLALTNNQAKGIPTNDLNNKQSLQKQTNQILKLEEHVKAQYQQAMADVNNLKTTYSDKPRIGIMLNTAESNYKKIYAYSVFNETSGAELQKEVIALPSKEQAITPEHNLDDLGPAAGA